MFILSRFDRIVTEDILTYIYIYTISRMFQMLEMLDDGNCIFRKGTEEGRRGEGGGEATLDSSLRFMYSDFFFFFFFPATSCLYYYSGATLRPPPFFPSSSSSLARCHRHLRSRLLPPLRLVVAPREQAARTISYGSSREQKYECINA